MTVTRLVAQAIEKPWGRTGISSHIVSDSGERRIGEIWFSSETERDLPLLVKYIYTSENLSIQVHPNDEQARARGLAGGKSECWYILDAEPSAQLGIGLKHEISSEELGKAALDGSIERLLDWKPVKAGSFYYIAAGTVHAIGKGVTLIEVQQNNPITYRLYDYGRPRELHLEQALFISKAEPYNLPERIVPITAEECLVSGFDEPFILDMIQAKAGTVRRLDGELMWFIPLTGYGLIDGNPWKAGECWLIENSACVKIDGPVSAFLARLPETVREGTSAGKFASSLQALDELGGKLNAL
ncbi:MULTISPECIES: class I mannose-6-phosphate isomerase [unclassified Sphingobium]|uniref:class I mannose-6-phosphate isomerase n=1 Tax=unclassified Sphingobium TaxID=2611147 RepID=UPI0007D91647|nr:MULTISPECIES: class I mannose-6-phosphate isomerase [unclassified Sphingobium]OAP29289.1 phosphoheptose isomerase [Sphingobium sp. 20006FA]